jgi:hypothetical protein
MTASTPKKITRTFLIGMEEGCCER